MDKKNEVKERPKQPMQNYVPRRDYGDMSEDEAMEIKRQQQEADVWQNSFMNTTYGR